MIDVCDARRFGSLYRRLIEQAIIPDTKLQADLWGLRTIVSPSVGTPNVDDVSALNLLSKRRATLITAGESSAGSESRGSARGWAIRTGSTPRPAISTVLR
ncbi:MAG TPA: hypothetical protein VFP98_10615 [Candidatus Polarisedimenticolia bacterium]|nr:hypothetical protein [Candidatus Polarisedimenticolia bacterium]